MVFGVMDKSLFLLEIPDFSIRLHIFEVPDNDMSLFLIIEWFP